jgi:hypothetical protein
MVGTRVQVEIAHKRSASRAMVVMPDRVEVGIVSLASDELHGAGYLARKALGLLLLVAPESRVELGRRLAELRPEMPSIAAAVNEALEEGDVRRVIRRADAERRRVGPCGDADPPTATSRHHFQQLAGSASPGLRRPEERPGCSFRSQGRGSPACQ